MRQELKDLFWNYFIDPVYFKHLWFWPFSLFRNMCRVHWNMCKVPRNMGRVYRNMCKVPRNMCRVPRNMCRVYRNMCKVPRNMCRVYINLCKVPRNMYRVPRNMCMVPRNMCKVCVVCVMHWYSSLHIFGSWSSWVPNCFRSHIQRFFRSNFFLDRGQKVKGITSYRLKMWQAQKVKGWKS